MKFIKVISLFFGVVLLLGGMVAFQNYLTNSSEDNVASIFRNAMGVVYNKYVSDSSDVSDSSGRSPHLGPSSISLGWKYQEKNPACPFLEVNISSPVIDSKGNAIVTTSEGKLLSLSSEGNVLWSYNIPDAYNRSVCNISSETAYAPKGVYDFNIAHPPTLDEKNKVVYFGTSGALNKKAIYAVDMVTGKLKWSKDIPGNGTDNALQSPIKIGVKQELYFTTKTHIYSMDKKGESLKSYVINSAANPLIGGNNAAITSNGNVVVCTAQGVVQLDGNLKEVWKYPTSQPLRFCDPAINPTSGAIYFSSRIEKKLFALDKKGTLLWSAPIESAESAPSVGFDGTIYIGATNLDIKGPPTPQPSAISNGIFFAFSPNGKEKWRYYVPSYVICKKGDPECPNADLYTNFRAIDGPSIVDKEGNVFFGTDAKMFVSLDKNGKERWRFVQGDEFDQIPTIASNGTIYVSNWGATMGGLFALRNDPLKKKVLENAQKIKAATITVNKHDTPTDLKHDIAINSGTTLDFKWSGTGAKTYTSTYQVTRSNAAKTCGPLTPAPWTANSSSGSTSFTYTSKYEGCSWVVIYSAGGVSDKITVSVVKSTPEETQFVKDEDVGAASVCMDTCLDVERKTRAACELKCR